MSLLEGLKHQWPVDQKKELQQTLTKAFDEHFKNVPRVDTEGHSAHLVIDALEVMESVAEAQECTKEYDEFKQTLNVLFDLKLPVTEAIQKNFKIEKINDKATVLKAFEAMVLNEVARSSSVNPVKKNLATPENLHNKNFRYLLDGVFTESRLGDPAHARMFMLTWALLRTKTSTDMQPGFVAFRDEVKGLFGDRRIDPNADDGSGEGPSTSPQLESKSKLRREQTLLATYKQTADTKPTSKPSPKPSSATRPGMKKTKSGSSTKPDEGNSQDDTDNN